MALIYADDFQQFGRGTSNGSGSTNAVSVGAAINISDMFEALGFYRPNAWTWGTVTQYWLSAAYSSASNCLLLADMSGSRGTLYSGTAQGLKRDIVQGGDTLFLSVRWASAQSTWRSDIFPGPFLELNDGLFSVEISKTYTYILNGVDTGYSALFDVEVTQFLEIIVGPNYIELWNGDILIVRQNGPTVPIKNFRLGIPHTGAADSYPASFMKVYSLIIADSSGTDFKDRIGRKLAQSVGIGAVTSTQSTLETYGSTTLLQTLQTPMQTLELNTSQTLGYGNIYSKSPYVKTVLTGSIGSAKKIYAAAINVQAKRRELSNDGMGILPYIKLSATEEYGPVFTPRGRWNGRCIPLAITPNITANAIEFGFTHEYVETTDNVYVDDRANVEVYGTKTTVYVPNLPFQAVAPKASTLALQTPTYNAYVFDYAKSNLNIANTPINNLTYMQDS